MIKHLWFWLVMTLIAIFIMPAVISSDTYQKRIFTEAIMLENTLGKDGAAQVMKIADSIYDRIFEESGFRAWVIEHYYVDDRQVTQGRIEGGAPVGIAAKLTHNYAIALFFNLYELTFRLTQMFIWGVYSLPFILASILDGAMQRQAKIISFSYSSPSVYNASWHFIIVMVFCSFFYFNTPFPVPPITFPIFVGVMAFMLRSLVANLQRSA